MKPFVIPNSMIMNHSLKKMIKTYDLDGAVRIIAKNVEKPPWNTLEPIYCRAAFVLNCLIYQGFIQFSGTSVFKYAYAICVE